MAKVWVFFRDPKGFQLDSLGTIKYLAGNGLEIPLDVSMSIRMLSIDTPEVHYPGDNHKTLKTGHATPRGLAERIAPRKSPNQ